MFTFCLHVKLLVIADKESIGKNLLFSPLSICLALGMVHMGVRGKTGREIAALMELDMKQNENDLRQQVSKGFEELIVALNSFRHRDIHLNTANALFVQENFAVINYAIQYFTYT